MTRARKGRLKGSSVLQSSFEGRSPTLRTMWSKQIWSTSTAQILASKEPNGAKTAKTAGKTGEISAFPTDFHRCSSMFIRFLKENDVPGLWPVVQELGHVDAVIGTALYNGGPRGQELLQEVIAT